MKSLSQPPSHFLQLTSRTVALFSSYLPSYFPSLLACPFIHSFTNYLYESESHSLESDSLQLHGLYSPWNPPGQNTGVGDRSILQGIFLTQDQTQVGLPRCRQILYQLSHQGSPRILEWVAYPFSSGSSQPRNQTRVSCTAGRSFTN